MRRVVLLAVLVYLGIAAFLQAPLAQTPQQDSNATKQAPALQAQTRLITVDVVATDSHGKPARGLTQDDFQLSEEHAGQQKIAKFRFIDTSAGAPTPPGPAQPSGTHVYSNQAFNKLTVPPSILLMDALNTDLDQQAFVHHQALMLLKTLPASTPVAVFVLGHSLEVLQSFTTDPALLRSAVDKMLRGIDIAQDPQDDPDSMSNQTIAANDGEDTAMNQTLEDFEKTAYEGQMSIRVDETTDAMVAIAKYLRGSPGRKNLLWFSEAFPNWIQPTTAFGADAFSGSASYEDKIQKAFEALADAQVAVYPVDARGLDVSQLSTAAATPYISPRNSGAGLARQQGRENDRRFAAQATLEQIAQQTGGKVCENTNNLSGCVQSAMDDSSAYYELGYYPENIRWDGRFHKITVKSNQHGVKLRYRIGYFATDAVTLAKDQTPEKLLQQACVGPLPSTSIPLTVVPLQSRPAQGQTGSPDNRYLLTISPGALTLPGTGASREMRVQMAVCEYDKKGDSFAIYPRDLSRGVPDALFADWQANGVRNIYDYDAKPESQRLRFAVLDLPSGATGSVDVPAHPPEFAVASPPAPLPPLVRIPFKGASGTSSALDWSSGTLLYHGDISVDQGALAFFKAAYDAKFHCDAGKLVANDSKPGSWPDLSLVFRTPGGHDAFVELGGDAPTYSGDITVDASGKAFFDILWKLSHCQQP